MTDTPPIPVKDDVLEAFEDVGGVRKWVALLALGSIEEKRIAAQLLAKCIPNELTGEDGGPVLIALKPI